MSNHRGACQIDTYYTYDSQGRTRSVTDDQGGSQIYSYDSNGNLEYHVDQLGATTSYTYDPVTGNMLTETNALGHTSTNSYDQYGNPKTSINPLGDTSTTSYDNKGNLDYQVDELGYTTSYDYDDYGNRTKEITALGATTSYDHNILGLETDIVSPIGTTTSVEYDVLGREWVQTQPDGQTATTSYNAMGHVEKVETPLGGTTFSYDALGNKTAETTPIGMTHYEYTAGYQLEKVIDHIGNTTSYEYDELGRKTKDIYATGGWVSYTYDSLGRIVEQTDSENGITKTTYDKAGNVLTLTTPKNETTTNSYDILGRLEKVTYPDSSWVEYKYNKVGHKWKEIQSSGQQTIYVYDEKGQLKQEITPLGTTTYDYDAVGNVESKTAPGNNTTTYEYELGIRPTETTDPNQETKTYIYDQLGRTDKETSSSGTTSYSYSNLSQLNTRVEPLNGTFSNVYDSLGRPSSKTIFGRTISVSYDKHSRMSESYDPLFGTFKYKYDDVSNLNRVIRPNSTSSSMSYDNLGKLSSIKNYKGNNLVDTYEYKYDANKLRNKVIANGVTSSYGYDAKGQMTSSVEKVITPAYPHTKYVWYDYDQNGNRKNMEVMLSTNANPAKGASITLPEIIHCVISQSPVYDTPDINDSVTQIVEFLLTGKKIKKQVSDDLINAVLIAVDQAPFVYRSTNNTSKDWLTGLYSPVTSQTHSYHYNTTTGNMQSYNDYYGNYTYQWDNKNRLTQHTTPSNTIDYVYDSEDRRITKTVKPKPANGQQATVYSYKYDGLAVMEESIEEKDSNGQTTNSKLMQYTYGDHDTPLALKLGNNKFYYVKDGHGDIREITDSNGVTIVKYSYDAWGSIIGTTAIASQAVTLQEAKEIAEINPYRYASYRYDTESNMYYLRARYYQPTIGRFASKDPKKFKNLYTYCKNDPINRADSSGRSDKKIQMTIVGDEEFRSKNWSNGWKSAVFSAIQKAMNFYTNSAYDPPGKTPLTKFGITFNIKGYWNWDSEDSLDTTNELLDDAIEEHGLQGAEVMIAFSANAIDNTRDLGMTIRPYVLIMYQNSITNISRAVRHEIGHLYSLSHCEGSWRCNKYSHNCFMRQNQSNQGFETLCNDPHRSSLWSNRYRY